MKTAWKSSKEKLIKCATKVARMCSSCSWLQNRASDLLIFAQGLMVFQSRKKRGKTITQLWKIMTKSRGNNLKIWGNLSFCRAALLLSTVFCLWQFVKTQIRRSKVPFFDIFEFPRWSPLRIRMCTKVVFFFIFFKSFPAKKLRIYDQKWLK